MTPPRPRLLTLRAQADLPWPSDGQRQLIDHYETMRAPERAAIADAIARLGARSRAGRK